MLRGLRLVVQGCWPRLASAVPSIEALREHVDSIAGLAGVLALAVFMQSALPGESGEAIASRVTGRVADTRVSGLPQWPETLIGGYGGLPYTHASNVRFSGPDGAELTLHGVNWDGRPFKSPIYYGVRAIRWGSGTTGGMLDFTHSKTISQRDQVVRISGTRNGQTLAPSNTIGDTFRHLEFSHGHNMVTLNGLLKLAPLSPVLQPYVGAGAGAALPHTEVQFTSDPTRTYEYQYTGPVGQAVLGLEVRLPRITLFVEYKFTLARYIAPLTGRNSTGWGLLDFPLQAQSWWRGERPRYGFLATTLASHQIIGGAAARLPQPSIAAER